MVARCTASNNYDGVVKVSEVESAAPPEISSWVRAVCSTETIGAQSLLFLASEHNQAVYEWLQDALFVEGGALYEEAV